MEDGVARICGVLHFAGTLKTPFAIAMLNFTALLKGHINPLLCHFTNFAADSAQTSAIRAHVPSIRYALQPENEPERGQGLDCHKLRSGCR